MSKKGKKKTVEEVLSEAQRIAFYGRVSTEKQEVENGQQTEKVDQFLSRYQKNRSKDFTDTKSAYSKSYTDRDDFLQLLIALEKKEFDAVVVSDRDRLSRQTDEHFKLREELNRLGVPVVIASRSEFYDSEDFIRNLIEDALTKMESDNISARTKAAMKSMKERDEYIGGQPPYGYKTVREKQTEKVFFLPIPEQMEKVRIIFSLFKKSETFSGIAKMLAIDSPSEKWNASKVKGIITNPIYTGFMVYNRYTVADGKRIFTPISDWRWIKPPITGVEQIVKYEDWWYCWHKYTSLRVKKPRYLSTSFYLSDLAVCQCGEYFIGKDQRTNINGRGKIYGDRYYICSNQMCKRKVPADKLHDLVLDTVFKLPSRKDLVEGEMKQLISDEIRNQEELVASYKKKLQREENNLSLIEGYEIKEGLSDRLLYESENNKLLAYLVSKSDSEDKVKRFRELLKNHETLLERLKDILSNDSVIVEKVEGFFGSGEWQSLSSAEIRSLALMMVESCLITSDNKVHLKVKTLPPDHLNLWGLAK
ncbi:recombinase family protein [Bacillus sp. J33]|uniref:recombinase family protein n=1 Tax=Bacillus sp. J33 TaxID=935836 RepID=UPI000479BEAE|nr:recombinase family protein [Bacillus sp. J33]